MSDIKYTCGICDWFDEIYDCNGCSTGEGHCLKNKAHVFVNTECKIFKNAIIRNRSLIDTQNKEPCMFCGQLTNRISLHTHFRECKECNKKINVWVQEETEKDYLHLCK